MSHLQKNELEAKKRSMVSPDIQINFNYLIALPKLG